ncbi:site-specific integrase [Rhizorhabdus wittichii]|uniref:Site-specific integrase n=1 Tax=Rhizorhabdus wittichii TaxID=160791 RepID=A0A975D032_9SPHN|nr:site-specific integrase [Rhizorhabdus wittichii]QTH19706.1 site-specific integrase [Rhizorhabdus wittichii]
MATGKITRETVDRLQAGSSPAFLWDDALKGFGVRASTSGSKTYIFQYRMGGREAKTKRYTIGKHGSPWTAATARMEAVRILTMVRQRTDPVYADKERRREAVELAFDAYADRFAKSCTGKGWRALVDRSLRLHLVPLIRDKPITQIIRTDIVIALDEIPIEQIANRRNVFAVARRLFRWAVSRGDIKISPMEGMETPKAVKPRDRWLTDKELPRIWNAAPLTHPCFGPIVRLLIATGQRREEVSGVDWSELDREARMWTLPGERTKNGEPNYIPLSDLAIAELDRVAGREKWPSRGRTFATSTGGGFSGFAKGKLKLDKLIGEDGGEPMPPWRLHDLRRTVATGFQRLGVRFEVTEAILNHVGGSRAGVAGIYQRHDWKPEKTEALRAWNDHLQSILSD